jgi:alkanesulfonate monooxygenase SsuD/methylene tetrahydromethanopterin reductase-like flavin-dependent oxidoreductase (luciferase family)
MAPRIGYLLPTRESIMEGRPDTRPLLALGERAERLGFDGLWIGDSLTARPRHDPLTLMAAVAARVPRVTIGTAVLLPALRNPVVLAHQAATIDQIAEGRLVLGVGIARDVPDIRAEFTAAGVPFEKRVGRVIEGMQLCRALWTGKPVDWSGRWELKGQSVGPTPVRAEGIPFWIAGSLPASLERAGTHFDGWLPNVGTAEEWRTQWATVKSHARAAGRDPAKLTGSMYLTVAMDDDTARASARLDDYLERYYNAPAVALKKRQSCFAGPAEAAAEWIASFARAGVDHIIVRFAGEHEKSLDTLARLRSRIVA